MVLGAAPAWAQGSLHGAGADPSGAAVPNATVEIDGGRRAHTGQCRRVFVCRAWRQAAMH